jgi:phage terminase Nu1 subunit (DNA packaging protein)
MKPFKTREIALLIGVTATRVRQLAHEGVLVRRGRDEFDGPQSVAGYMAFKERRLVDELGGPGSMAGERRKLVSERARMAQLERERMEAKLVPANQVAGAFSAMAGALRSHLLSLPAKLAAKLGMATNAVERQAILTTGIHEALEHLSGMTVGVEPDPDAEPPPTESTTDDATDEGKPK